MAAEGFCTLCNFEVQSFEGLTECPNCGTKGVPSFAKDQVQISINLQELRLLCIWAENWGSERCSDAGGANVVYAVANRIRKQLAGEHAQVPLTMHDEFEKLREAGVKFVTNHPAADTPELGKHYQE